MGSGMINARFENTEAQRPRSLASRFSSVISVPLCFNPSQPEIAEHGDVLTHGRTDCAEEVEHDGAPVAKKTEAYPASLPLNFTSLTEWKWLASPSW